MNKFAKFLFVVVVLAALVIFVAPYPTGFAVKSRYDNLVAQTNKPESIIHAEVTDYQQGWFNSKATVKLTFSQYFMNLFSQKLEATPGAPSPDLTAFNISYTETLHHGPVIANFGKHRLSPITFALAQSSINIHENNLDFDGYVTLHYNGNIQVNLKTPRVAKVIDEKTHDAFVLQNLEGNMLFDSQLKNINGEFNIAALDISDKNGTPFSLKNVVFNLNTHLNKFDIRDGYAKFSVGTLNVTTPENEHLGVQGFAFDTTSKTKNAKWSSEINATVKELQYNDKNLGKQEFTFSFDNFDAAATQQLTKVMQEVQNEKNPMVAINKVLPALSNFLQQGFQMSLKSFDLNTVEGRINAKGQVVLAPSKAPYGDNLEQLANNVTAEATIEVPMSFIQSIAEEASAGMKNINNQASENKAEPKALANDQIERWKAMGWLVQSGDKYQFAIRFEKGKFMLNGKAVSIPDLMGPQQQAPQTTPVTPTAPANVTPVTPLAPAAAPTMPSQ